VMRQTGKKNRLVVAILAAKEKLQSLKNHSF